MTSTQINENAREAYFALSLLASCALDVLNLGLDVFFPPPFFFFFPLPRGDS